MNTLLQSIESEPDWAQISPLLDEAMHILDEPDREAVLLRHFERQSYVDIGARFGLTENAARMRVERALEKLRDALVKRGVTSTAMVLAGLLTSHAVGAAPASLGATVARMALAGGAAGSGLSTFVKELLAVSKIKLAAAGVALAVVVAGIVVLRNPNGGPSRPDASKPAVFATNSIAAIPAVGQLCSLRVLELGSFGVEAANLNFLNS